MDNRTCRCPVCRSIRSAWDAVKFFGTVFLAGLGLAACMLIVWTAACLMGGN